MLSLDFTTRLIKNGVTRSISPLRVVRNFLKFQVPKTYQAHAVDVEELNDDNFDSVLADNKYA